MGGTGDQRPESRVGPGLRELTGEPGETGPSGAGETGLARRGETKLGDGPESSRGSRRDGAPLSAHPDTQPQGAPMATRAPRPRTQPRRTVRVLDADGVQVLNIVQTEGRQVASAYYHVRRLESDLGPAFELYKSEV